MKKKIELCIGNNIFVSNNSDFYLYDKLRGIFMGKKIEPYLSNEFWDIYLLNLGDEAAFMPVIKKNSKKRVLQEYFWGTKKAINCKLLGEDLAFAMKLSMSDKDIVVWKIIARNAKGKYVDAGCDLGLGSNYICTLVDFVDGVLKVHCAQVGSKEIIVSFFRKVNGFFENAFEKISAEKVVHIQRVQALKQKTIPEGFVPLFSLGFDDVEILEE